MLINQRIRLFSSLAAAAFAVLGVSVYAQIEGSDRGIPVVDSVSNFEVGGIAVDVAGKSADVARLRGWREAQRLGWKKLWQKMHGGNAPGLSDGALDSIVSGIVIEDEMISEHRYIAKLGVTFDRVRAAEILGVGGQSRRSAPLLLIPIMWDGGVAQSYETRTEWQKAWAAFRTDESPIDYVRPIGNGADPLLLTAGQLQRPGRKWWRALLDQYGAVDLLVAQVELIRSYPGGPVTGRFTASYGPDNKVLEVFTLKVQSSAEIPTLMAEGAKRIDGAFARALASGVLKPDTSLIIEQIVTEEELEAPEPDTKAIDPNADKTGADQTDKNKNAEKKPVEEPKPALPTTQTITIQFDSPDPSAVYEAESAVQGVPGVKSASTTSVAVGGTSVMRVVYEGDADMLRASLSARGYRVQGSGTSLHISK
jgi:hypothetical protein